MSFLSSLFFQKTSAQQSMRQVSDGRHWMIKQHPRPGPAHHCTHLFPHLRLVAVYGALLARRFAVGKAAMVEPSLGIVQQFSARLTQLTVALLFAAIQPYHLLHHTFFVSQSAHNATYKWCEYPVRLRVPWTSVKESGSWTGAAHAYPRVNPVSLFIQKPLRFTGCKAQGFVFETCSSTGRCLGRGSAV